MLARCHSACARGVDGEPTEVEVHLRDATPRFDVVGLPDAAGREARDRVRSAIVSSGFKFPKGRLVVNLAPADSPKVGPVHDLPIALGVLAAAGLVDQEPLEKNLMFGELALDGRLRPVRGAFLLASTAKPQGLTGVLAPPENADEAALATASEVFAPRDLSEAVRFLHGDIPLDPVVPREDPDRPPPPRDFVEVRGQEAVKRAVIVAAAGGHNLLFVGPPGSGKTLLAERFPDLLPPLSRAEALEVARARSAAGVPVDGLPRLRPLRAPSCGASPAGLLGGGSPPRPGEVTLAHRGVLFLDELPYFRGDVLESLRQPLESGTVTLSRAGVHVTFPAAFQFLSAMNPCPCGFLGTPRCTCTNAGLARYRRRLSGPLLDRIDLRVHVPAVSYDDLRNRKPGLTTSQMRDKVARAHAVQSARYGDPARRNADLRPAELDTWCLPDAQAESLLERASKEGRLSARGIARVRRVARTLADLEGVDHLTAQHVLEALQWRVEPT